MSHAPGHHGEALPRQSDRLPAGYIRRTSKAQATFTGKLYPVCQRPATMHKIKLTPSIMKNNMVKSIEKTNREYSAWIKELKLRYLSQRIKASVAVNTNLLEFYWSLGKDISKKQFQNTYGSGFYKKLSAPFRKYFVKEMHGKYPFPEATASTQVLVSGQQGGGQAKL